MIRNCVLLLLLLCIFIFCHVISKMPLDTNGLYKYRSIYISNIYIHFKLLRKNIKKEISSSFFIEYSNINDEKELLKIKCKKM